jgi:hypothetical protein
MKWGRVAAGLGIALLGLSLAAGFFQPSPVEVARDYCAGRGLPADKLVLRQYRGTGGLFGIGNRETVEFQVQGAAPKKVVVELRQPVYFLAWQVVDYREEAERPAP